MPVCPLLLLFQLYVKVDLPNCSGLGYKSHVLVTVLPDVSVKQIQDPQCATECLHHNICLHLLGAVYT